MAAPATIDDFLALLRSSEVVDGPRLEEYWQQLLAGGDVPDRTYRLARRMVADGLLTNFHAEQLLRGKSRGFTLRNYRILERIGRGGMGTVYLAEHLVMRHRVAIKVLPADQAENPAIRERFFREARSTAALSHPNLIRAHDIDQDQGVHYLVMDFVEGVTLQHLVARKGPLPFGRAAHYVGQAAIGLQHAHEVAGLVHRDIKPGNLLVDRNGTVKILDMGLARMALAGFFNAQSDNITKNYNDKSVLGTADYIAPEQAVNSQAADVRADVYSLGATFYYVLTGGPPFPMGTVTQKLLWHQIREPAPIHQLRPDVPSNMVALIEQMMAKDPAHRPQTPGAVVEALTPWIDADMPPPGDDEIPTMCRAAQTPGSNVPGSAASVAPAIRLTRSIRPISDTATVDWHTDVRPCASTVSTASAAQFGVIVPVSPEPASSKHPVQRRWWIAAAAALIAVAGSVAWWHVQSGPAASAQRSRLDDSSKDTPIPTETNPSGARP